MNDFSFSTSEDGEQLSRGWHDASIISSEIKLSKNGDCRFIELIFKTIDGHQVWERMIVEHPNKNVLFHARRKCRAIFVGAGKECPDPLTGSGVFLGMRMRISVVYGNDGYPEVLEYGRPTEGDNPAPKPPKEDQFKGYQAPLGPINTKPVSYTHLTLPTTPYV